MMLSLLVLSVLFAVVSAQTKCWIDRAKTLAGTCTKRSKCQGSNALWVKSKNWRGKKKAWGCEKESWRVRCCYKQQPSVEREQPKPQPSAPKPKPVAQPAPATAVSAFAKKVLDFHNDERACYGAPALKWDKQLELNAKAYAAKCIWGHAPRSERKNQGENLAAGSGQWDALTLLNGWLEEQFQWDCQRNSCRKSPCGHYTQMIWAKSTTLGCGAIVCHKGSPFGGAFAAKPWTNVVCRYGPPGNFIGQHPTGTGKCGSCARSVKTNDAIWAPDDTFQICVPSEGNDMAAEGAEALPESTNAQCQCPDGSMDTDGACVPAQLTECDSEPVECSDGTTLYPRPPDCLVACPEEESSNSLRVGAAAFVGAAAAGEVLVL